METFYHGGKTCQEFFNLLYENNTPKSRVLDDFFGAGNMETSAAGAKRLDPLLYRLTGNITSGTMLVEGFPSTFWANVSECLLTLSYLNEFHNEKSLGIVEIST